MYAINDYLLGSGAFENVSAATLLFSRVSSRTRVALKPREL
jgi:hypothetical protein